MKAAPAIGFQCRRSPSLVTLTLVIALLAVVASQLVGAHPWLHRGLLLLALAFVIGALRSLIRPAISALVWHPDGGADITLRSGSTADARVVQGAVQGGRVVGPLIVLTVRWPPRERVHLWLLPDNADAETRRRLRMRLASGVPSQFASGDADSH